MTYVGTVVDHAGIHVFGLTDLIHGMMMTLYGIMKIQDHIIDYGGYNGAERSSDDHICIA